MMMNNFDKFQEALYKNQKIYVLNQTDPRSVYIVSYPDPSSGKMRKLEFAKTWIPYCLNELVTEDVLRTSIELREAMSKGMLKVISKEEADKILSTPRAQEEYNRVFKSKYASSNELSAQVKEMNDLLTLVEATDADVLNPDLHSKIPVWQSRLATEEINGTMLLNDLEIYKDELTELDLQYIAVSTFPKEAKQFAETQLKSGSFKTKEV